MRSGVQRKSSRAGLEPAMVTKHLPVSSWVPCPLDDRLMRGARAIWRFDFLLRSFQTSNRNSCRKRHETMSTYRLDMFD